MCVEGERIMSGSTVGGAPASGGGEVKWILLSSIFHGSSPFRSVASVHAADGSILFYL